MSEGTKITQELRDEIHRLIAVQIDLIKNLLGASADKVLARMDEMMARISASTDEVLARIDERSQQDRAHVSAEMARLEAISSAYADDLKALLAERLRKIDERQDMLEARLEALENERGRVLGPGRSLQ